MLQRINPSKVIRVTVFVVVFALLTITALLLHEYWGGSGYFDTVSEVYLPKSVSEAEPAGRISLAQSAQVVHSFVHGNAVVFTSTDNFSPQLYEQNDSESSKISQCPNVFGEQSLDPGKCSYAGKAQNASVYTLQRNIDATSLDAYAVLGKTFIACQIIDGSNQIAVAYVASLRIVTNSQVDQVLAANKNTAAKHNAGLPAKAE